MNKKVKQLWLEALRSGEYKQGETQLRKGNKYCCLGVLCDIYRKNFGGKWDKTGAFEDSYTYTAESFLPEGVRRWSGLNAIDPDIEDIALSTLNDGGVPDCPISLTFDEIADLIQVHL